MPAPSEHIVAPLLDQRYAGGQVIGSVLDGFKPDLLAVDFQSAEDRLLLIWRSVRHLVGESLRRISTNNDVSEANDIHCLPSRLSGRVNIGQIGR